jgi:hypothetical protein
MRYLSIRSVKAVYASEVQFEFRRFGRKRCDGPKQQIPYGNDRKKSKSKSKYFASLRMKNIALKADRV